LRTTLRGMAFGCWMIVASLSVCAVRAQGVEVSGKIIMHSQKQKDGAADVVVWLTPLQPEAATMKTAGQGGYRLVQKHKMFTPHLLVVPTGSYVEFPNQDPFFHNVFSLYNGKRFDLGLYESGMTRSVRFDREGPSYIFCNIHPEMGAVVLALSTPFYAISGEGGAIAIHNVPPGSYRMGVWSENGQVVDQSLSGKIVQVGRESVSLGELVMTSSPDPLVNHKNKFGADYPPNHDHRY
jgi:plastocyanin